MELDRTDAELISASFADPETFAGVFDRHAAAIGGYLVRRVGPADGESLLGELFRIAFETRGRFDLSRPDARPWLYGIASRLVMKHFRNRERQRSAFARSLRETVESETPFDERIVNDSHSAFIWNSVAQAIGELPERDREVLMLYVFGDLSYSEIAESLDIPTGTVRSRLNRVRVAMRRHGNGIEMAPQDASPNASWRTRE